MASDYELTARTYTDPERTRIVPEDYPGGGILLGIAGDRIPAAEAERLGLTKSGDAGGPEPLDLGDPGPGADATGDAAADAGGARGRSKAVRQTSVEDKGQDGPAGSTGEEQA